MDIEILLNFGIVLFGIFNLLKLQTKKIFSFKVTPIWNPIHLLVLPLAYLFVIPNGIFLLILYCIFYVTGEHKKIYENKKFISKQKLYVTIKTLSICWVIFLIVSLLSKIIFGDLPEQSIVTLIRNSKINSKIVEIFFWTIFISPIIEEIFFRKIMYSTLKFYLAPINSILISSFIFSFVHANISVFPLLFTLGIILCLIFEKTNSIIYPIILHSLFNFIMLIFIFNS